MLWIRTTFLLLLCAGISQAADWPQWLGLNRDGITTETVQPWNEPPKPLWKQAVGEGFSVPVIANGRVFVHARVSDKEAEEVLAFDARTGKLLWRTAYARGPYMSLIGSGPRATPAVVFGRVYTFGITGLLTCFDANNGKQLWQTDVFQKLQVTQPRFGVTCSPLVVGNRILLSVGGSGSAVAAFDTETGEAAWKGLDGPISVGSPVLFINKAKQGRASLEAVFVNGQGLVAINPFDGTVSWEIPLSDQPLGTAPSPVVAGDLVLASSTNTGGVGIKLAIEDGQLTPSRAWTNPDLTGYFATPVVADANYFYICTTVTLPQPSTTLRCVETRTGKETWNQPKVGFFHAGLIRTGNSKLLLLDDSGTLRLIEHDFKAYRELCRASVCGPTFSSPAFANGCLFVRDNKSVICIPLNPAVALQ